MTDSGGDMTDPIDRGPYINDDGDIWLPVDAWGWNEARREAAGYAADSDGASYYRGQVLVPLWEEDPEDAVERLAYHFEVVNRHQAAKQAGQGSTGSP